MATLVIPAPPPPAPDLDVTTDAGQVGTGVARAREKAAAASSWAQEGGAPTDWDGAAAEAADHARTRQMGALDVAVAALHRAETAFAAFAGQVAGLRTRRTALVDRFSSLASRQRDLAARGASFTDDEEAGLRAEASALQTDIDGYVTDIDAWQRDLTAAEDTLVTALQSVDTTAEGEQLVAATSDQVRQVMSGLVARGVLPAGAETWSADELRTYLIAHPDAAAALMQNSPSPGAPGPAGELGALVGPAFIDPAAAAADQQRRSDGLRALFESLSPEDARLLATLYPTSVGNASGVPFEYRSDANTVAVVTALEAEGGNLEDLRREHEDNQHDGDLFGLNNNDLEGDITDAEDRMALYQSILDDDRQIIAFDASGDGTIAELHGDIGSGTTNVGVQVPGTTTDMSSFQGVADTASSFVENSDGLAMISWMGGDLPDGIVADAPDPSYAQDLGPRLAGFSQDVRQEIDHSTAGGNDVRTTYLGHSYGGAVVGLAETYGLDADRVLHVESAGMGAGVDDAGDLPPSQDDVDRYSMTAPDDPIGLTQGVGAFGLGHGADPDDFAGTTELFTGNTADGSFNTGSDAHSGVFEVRSDAWQNMRQVLVGGDVETYRAPTYEVYPSSNPYAPPAMVQDGWAPGTTVDIE